MPEEHNRILIDHLADVQCAAIRSNMDNFLKAGVGLSRITLTGNSVVNAETTFLPPEKQRLRFLRAAGVRPGGYVRAAIHRHENTDDPDVLAAVLEELDGVAREGWPVLMPLHPRTAAAIDQAGLTSATERHLTILPPVGYAEFLSIARYAAILMWDSGGVQEEVTVLKRPLTVLRRSTERPGVLDDFAQLAGPGESAAKLSLANLAPG